MDHIVYLVAILKGELNYCATKIQQCLWNKYNLGEGNLPEIHLTIDAFYYTDDHQLANMQKDIKNITGTIEPFEIKANGFSYIPAPYNCITIHIVKDKLLKDIYTYIHFEMQNHGYKVRDFAPEEMIFHISLAGIYGRKWTEREAMIAWEEIKEFKIEKVAYIEELQLWHPELDSSSKILAKINLGNRK